MLRASVVLLVADNVAIAGFLAAVFAEFERDVIRERIKAGIIDARTRGKTHGRPYATANDATQMRTLAQQGLSQVAIARHWGLWRTSGQRVLAQQEGTCKPRALLVTWQAHG
jgi:DNA invertase Pin-like site-specific DNA recombinase